MTLIEEWNELFNKNDKIYFYGAGTIARLLVSQAEKFGFSRKIKALLVSKNSNNCDSFHKIPITNADSISDKNTPILICVSKKYYDEIYSNAIKLGFSKIQDGFSFVHLFDENESALIHSDEILKRNKIDFKNELYKILGSNQLFGNNQFYQSLPLLDIPGIRPSDFRIKTYKLNKIVENKDVLDIGCNCGFLDLSIASNAKEITGLEYNKNLSIIANLTANYLDINNIHFEHGDFIQYKTEKKFDVILFFAVHAWINLTPEEGVHKIKNLLSKSKQYPKRGHVVFESQDLKCDNGDPLYEAYCLEFLNQGFIKEDNGNICDDGKTYRSWCVFGL